jgi:hypothetical protein
MAVAYQLHYSGVEGPTAKLSSAEEAQLLIRVRGLKHRAPTPRIPLSGPGYTVDFSDNSSAPCGGVTVGGGLVAVYARTPGDPTYYVDDQGVGLFLRIGQYRVSR